MKKLRQSNNGRSPNPPLTHEETVRTDKNGKFGFVMTKTEANGAHMDLNGMIIKPLGINFFIFYHHFLGFPLK